MNSLIRIFRRIRRIDNLPRRISYSTSIKHYQWSKSRDYLNGVRFFGKRMRSNRTGGRFKANKVQEKWAGLFTGYARWDEDEAISQKKTKCPEPPPPPKDTSAECSSRQVERPAPPKISEDPKVNLYIHIIPEKCSSSCKKK